MADKRKLPVGVQSFEVLRNGNYLYVDKTKYIWDLVQSGRVYFLSRPRRFGKSLLVSTMEAYFEGKKELFDGLAIKALEGAKGKDAWQTYPVIKFSLSGGDYHAPDGLAKTLERSLEFCEKKYGIARADYDLPNRFGYLIEQLCQTYGHPVVVLVDEYDKPLLSTMFVDDEQEEKNRRLYKGFFSVLKDEDQYLKFVFFTGVTKFSKVSIFSDLNQLKDISMNDAYPGICGITEEELGTVFAPEIRKMAQELELAEEECCKSLADMYDGYHFSKKSEGVYNPFSLLNALQDRDLGSYWFETGTPTFLIHALQNSNFTAEQFTDGVEASEAVLMDYRADNPNPIPLFYQTGYLTISGFDREFRIYTLKFPNREVKYGFLNSLLPFVVGEKDAESPVSLRRMIKDLRCGELDSFMGRLVSLFAGIPYPEGTVFDYEREWRNQIFLVLALLGQHVKCEVHSSGGRADCIVETDGYIYIFEFKVDKSADEALFQIDQKGYAVPYQTDIRKIYKVGVSFSSLKRNISEWRAAEVH